MLPLRFLYLSPKGELMKKMIKKTSALLLAAAMAVSLAACSGGAKSETAAGSEVLRTIPETNAPTAAPETKAEETTAAPETKAAETTAAPETTKAPETTAVPETTAAETEAAPAPEEDEPAEPIHARIRSQYAYDQDPETYKTYFRMTTAEVLLSEEDAARFPELAKTLEEDNALSRSENADYFRSMGEESRAIFQEAGEGAELQFSDETKADVVRADSNILSVRFYNESYSGGVHGYFFHYGHTYDVKTGKALSLTDVVTDLDELKKTIIPLLKEKYGSHIDVDLETTFADFTEENFFWSLTPVGLELYFAPYMLAAYASGELYLALPFAEYPELLNQKYAAACEEYVLPFGTENSLLPAAFDLGGDGSINEIGFIPRESGNYYDYSGYNVLVDGKEYRLGTEEFLYDFYTQNGNYLVHTKGGDYIYCFAGTDNDYSILYVTDLNGKEPKDAPDLNTGASVYSEYDPNEETDDSWTTLEDAFTDPNSVRLTERGERLSTYSMFKTFRIGANGAPESNEPYYYVINYKERSLKMKEDYTAEEVDLAGKSLGTIDLKKGDELYIFRTNNEDIVDLELKDDGRLVRITLDMTADTWVGVTMDGRPVDELFDDMLFAG